MPAKKKKTTVTKPTVQLGKKRPAATARAAARKRAQAQDAKEAAASKVPPRNRRGGAGKPGRVKGATSICDEDLIDYIMHQFAQGRRPWMVREAVVDWVERFHPGRPRPSRTTVDKAMALARKKIREYCEFEDPEAVLQESVRHYQALASDPGVRDDVRLKARVELDRLLGIGAQFTSTFLSPEAQAARALEFLRQARGRRSMEDEGEEDASDD